MTCTVLRNRYERRRRIREREAQFEAILREAAALSVAEIAKALEKRLA